jgi:uncharacterized NAD-dependent epimerase/dehydratase family protein
MKEYNRVINYIFPSSCRSLILPPLSTHSDYFIQLNMKKIFPYYSICTIFIALCSLNAFAQNVGVGTLAPSAQLHVNGTVRLENLPLNNSNSTILGMDASGNLARKSADYWSLNGNTGINPATNFLGTIDNADLSMRVGNLERVRITTNGAFVVGGGFSANTTAGTAWSTLVSGFSNSVTNADKSIVLGWLNSATAHNQYLIGVNNTATNEYGFAYGIDLRSNADKAFVMGTGTSGGKLTNSATHSLLIGFTGSNSVGVNTINPTGWLHVRTDATRGVRFENLSQGTSDSALVLDGLGNVKWKNITGGGGGTGWGITGNTGINPATNFLGTIDNADLSMRVGNLERVRITTNGAFVVGGGLSANTTTGTTWSTLISGFANSATNADKSIVLGWLNSATAHNQYLIGVNNTATNEYGFAYGIDLRSNADKAFVMGTGTSGGKLTNSATHSLLIGFTGSNSMFINSNSVGVNTINPTGWLHVRTDATRGIRFENLSQGTSDSALVLDGLGNVKWKTITGGGGGTGWGLNGNGGTNPATQFVGTTDNNDLAFRVAGVERMRVGSTGLGINTLVPTAGLHVKADATGGVRFESLTQSTSDSALVIDGAGNVKWKTISGGGTGWGLTGNSGTNPATNFIGNTDNVDFTVRVGNLDRVKITTNGAFVVGGGLSANTTAGTAWSTLVSGFSNSVNNADKSIVLGWLNSATAHNQYLIGVNNTATNEYGFAYGIDLRSNADKAFVMGTGTSGGKLTNSNTHSMLIGFTGSNSLFINSTSTAVFTTTPTQRFHVKCDSTLANGGIRFENLAAGPGYFLTVDNNGNVKRSDVQSTARMNTGTSEEVKALRKELEEARKEIDELKQRMDRLLPVTTKSE